MVRINTNCNSSSAQDALTPRRVIFVEPVEPPRRTPLPFLRPGCLRRDITAWAESASAWSAFGASSRKCRRRIWPKNGEKKNKKRGPNFWGCAFPKRCSVRPGKSPRMHCGVTTQFPGCLRAITSIANSNCLARFGISLRNLAQTEARHSPPGDHPRYHDSLPTGCP